MGFDFTLIAPLLPSHCGFSFVFGCGVSSLVKSRVFLSMIVQQPVVILVLLQEGVRARPSTLPSWLILRWPFFIRGRECQSFFLKFIYLFIWLSRVLVVTHRILISSCGAFISACGILVAVCWIFSCGTWTLSCGIWDLGPWPGIEPGPPALGAWSLSHWTTREVPRVFWTGC